MNAITPQPSGTLANGTESPEDAGLPSLHLDFRRFFAALYRNRYFIAAILVAALIAGFIYTLSKTPIYQTAATVQIENQARDLVNIDGKAGSETPEYDTELFLQTQIDILGSRAIARRVVSSLGLAASDEYFRRMQETPPLRPAAGLTMAETRREAIAGSLMRQLVAKVPRSSRIVAIAMRSPDPVFAARLATAYAETFIAANIDRKFDSSAYARRYLEDELAKAKSRLEGSELAQINYARAHNIIDLQTGSKDGSAGGTQSLLITNLVEANVALNAARSERILAQERYRSAAGGSVLSIPEVQQSAAIQQLMATRAAALAEIARDSSRYRTDHPVMLQHQDQLRTLDQQIASQGGTIRDSLRRQYETAARNEQQLQAQANALRSGNQVEQGSRVQYNILARETNTNRTMYDGLLQRFKEVSAAAGVTSSNLSLIDKAEVPGRPVEPRPLINLALAFLGGLAVAALFVLLREYYDDATRTPDDIINKLRVPFLGIVPKYPAGSTPDELLADPKSSVSEAFAALRTSLTLLSSNASLKTMLVTSSRESEGKSAVVYGIARAFARAGQRVLVVDADLRRPSQHRLFGVSRDVGLTDVLSRQRPWNEVVLKTPNPKVDFLPSGAIPPSVPELLSGGAMEQLLESAQQSYDLVLLDAPPVLGLADVVILGQMVNHVAYVIESGRPLRGRGLAAIRRLKAAGIRIDGAILNKFDPKNSGYGYEYGYYYYYGKDA